MSDDLPLGQRFSHIYLERGTATDDSPRFRRRLAAFLSEIFSGPNSSERYAELAQAFRREIGIDVPSLPGGYGYDFTDFFASISLVDLFDGITIAWRCMHGPHPLRQADRSRDAEAWVAFLQVAFDEENLRYRVDEQGGVHYKPDEEFERNRVSALTSLQSSRYNAVREAFESAQKSLDSRDSGNAIRSVVIATEILVKLMAGDKRTARLGPTEVEKILRPIAQSVYKTGTPEANAANGLLSALKDWVTAAQSYRHGQKQEDHSPVPIEIAVAMVSTGASYLRWLVDIDHQAN